MYSILDGRRGVTVLCKREREREKSSSPSGTTNSYFTHLFGTQVFAHRVVSLSYSLHAIQFSNRLMVSSSGANSYLACRKIYQKTGKSVWSDLFNILVYLCYQGN